MHTNNQVTRYRSINYAYISMYYAYLSMYDAYLSMYYAYTTRTVHVLINITSHIAAGIAVSCTLKPLHISLHMLRI